MMALQDWLSQPLLLASSRLAGGGFFDSVDRIDWIDSVDWGQD